MKQASHGLRLTAKELGHAANVAQANSYLQIRDSLARLNQIIIENEDLGETIGEDKKKAFYDMLVAYYEMPFIMKRLDVLDDKVFEVDESCFLSTNKEKSPLAYNEFVDPFVTGPYNGVYLLSWNQAKKTAVFEQTYCSGGGCAQEGIITMSLQDDTAFCDIDLTFKDITDRY